MLRGVSGLLRQCFQHSTFCPRGSHPPSYPPVARSTLRCSTSSARFDLHTEGESKQENARKKKMRDIYDLELRASVEALIARHQAKDAKLPRLESIVHPDALFALLREAKYVGELTEHFVSTGCPYRVHRVLSLSHQLGCKIRPNVYEAVAYQLAQANHWKAVRSLTIMARRHTGKATLRLLNWFTRALVETKHYALLKVVLDEFQRGRIEPDRRTFHLLIKGFLQNLDLPHARDALRRMEAAGFRIDASTHRIIIAVYRSFGPDADVEARAFEALRDVESQAATSILNSLIRLRLDAKDLPGAFRILSFFDQRRLNPNLTNKVGPQYTPLAERDLSPLEVTSLSSELRTSVEPANVVTPDASTFNMLIEFMALRKDLAGAQRMLSRMTEARIIPDSGTAAALVHAFCAAGDRASAVRLVASICDGQGVASSLFDSLIATLPPESMHTDQAPVLLPQIPPSVGVFNTLLQGGLDAPNISFIVTVFRIMTALQIQPDDRTVEVLMKYLEQVEHASPRQLSNALGHFLSSELNPTPKQVYVILKAILRRDKYRLQGKGWNLAAAKFSRHRVYRAKFPTAARTQPNMPIDPIGGFDFGKRAHLNRHLRRFLGSLTSRDFRADRAGIALRIRHEAAIKADLRLASEIFRRMAARGMHPNQYHFSALMEGYSLAGNPAGVRKVMNDALEAGIKPNVVMFTILIVAYARRGDPDSAMRVFWEMVNAGIRPDPPSIDAVASAFFIVGSYKVARGTLVKLWPFVQAPMPPELANASLHRLAREMRALKANNRDPPYWSRSRQEILFQRLKALKRAWRLFYPRRQRRRLRRRDPTSMWHGR